MLTKLKNLFTKDEASDTEKEKSVLNQELASENADSKSVNNSDSPDNSVAPEIQNVTGEQISDVPQEKQVNVEEVKEEVIKVLRTCYDPEIPVDVWELGLIYDILVAVNGDVLIVMTLTSPACPVAGILPVEIEQKVKSHPKVTDCKVQLTFDPPWNQNMMSEVAKLELGFL